MNSKLNQQQVLFHQIVISRLVLKEEMLLWCVEQGHLIREKKKWALNNVLTSGLIQRQ